MNSKKNKLVATILCGCLAFPTSAFAHSGGTNSDECHNSNLNAGYHCHNSKGSDSSGGEILLAVLIVGATYWYLSKQEVKSSNNYKIDQTNKEDNRLKFSFKPTTNTEKPDGVSLQVSYPF